MHTNAIKDMKSLQNRGNKVTQTDYQANLTVLFMSRKSLYSLFIYLFRLGLLRGGNVPVFFPSV